MKAILYKDWLSGWLAQREGFVKEATLAGYSTAVANHIVPQLGGLPVSEVTEERLQETVLEWLTAGRRDGRGGLSERTVRGLVAIIRMSLKSAARAGYTAPMPLEIRYPKSDPHERLRVFSQEQQQVLTEYILQHPTPRRMGVLLCLHTGLRIGELCALQWKDIDFAERTLTVSRTIQRIYEPHEDGSGETRVIITPPKSRTSRRTIPLSSMIFPILEEMRVPDPEAYVLTGSRKYTEPRTYRESYDRLLRELGLGHITFHGLRHTFATRLIEHGADYKTVSELLGHANVNLTLHLYVHPQMEQKRRAVELMASP
ncbi:MAG: site-specific integrase [Oscillospiraceae bacterium]|nr:site-specific integrase [Oscillospiraceae bacterium]MBQ7012822.1 site-specific integrase [Oscillospiraceae bacterium]